MASVNKDESDREDGEIVEDDFEDISDSSLILTTTGKCISPKEHLPEISLSSVSEAEEMEKFKHRCRRNRRAHRKRKYSHRKTICLDSDSDEYAELDRKLLRAAIHIDKSDCLSNSLHTRLKAMNTVENDTNKEQKEEPKQDTEIECQNVSSDEGDDDLIQLRLEALRTAVLNKFKHRKRTKIKEISESDDFEDIIFSDNSEKINDKENEVALNNETSLEQIVTVSTEITSENQAPADSDNQIPQEEDEDVLRALLLASLSKKISEDNNVVSLQIQPPTIAKVYSQTKTLQQNNKKSINTNPYKKTTVNKKITANKKTLQHSKVQPIIININCDSDSEDEILNKSSKRSNISIENSVEKFLKEQRAKVEEESNKNESFQSSIFNNSSLKLLPKIKQIEYHNLLKKLHEAQKTKQRQKTKDSKLSENKGHPNSGLVQNGNQGLKKQNGNQGLKKQNGNQGLKKSLASNRFVKNKNFAMKSDVLKHSHLSEQIPDLKNEVRILHKVLKEIQTQKSDRLQMQTKYTTLTPIVRKINEASTERKKCDKEVQRLLKELAEAKKKLCETHINITNYVRELVKMKEEIDEKSVTNLDQNTKMQFTSTPAKDIQVSKRKKTDIESEIVVENANLNDIKEKSENCKTEVSAIHSDLNKLYSQPKGVLPKYTSPLDNMERLDLDDPFLIMCPYDIDGNCRDPECVFKHYRN